MSNAKILIIDDDSGIGYMLSRIAHKEGHQTEQAFSIKEGLNLVAQKDYDLIFLDVYLPDGQGPDILPQLKQLSSSPEIIIITGFGDSNGAELALKNGAWDYIEKTNSNRHISLSISRALRYRQHTRANRTLSIKKHGLVCDSPQMQNIMEQVAQASSSKATVLITGETGTGKEVIARAIYENSPYSDSEFIVVDCASLTESLAESILFGHVKGAFTGASSSNTGLIKLADGGILFMDEVGELSLNLQKTFLRVLQERRFRPLGGNKETNSDFKLIAASNKDLQELCRQGEFREDLYFRLKSFQIHVPPLRERKEDLKSLVHHHIHRISERDNKAIKGISQEFLEALKTYHWPGNIRELIQVLENCLVVAVDEPMLFPEHLPTELRVHAVKKGLSCSTTSQEKSVNFSEKINNHTILPTFRKFRTSVVSEAEQHYLKILLQQSQGCIKKACEISGLSRTRLYYLMKEHNIEKQIYKKT